MIVYEIYIFLSVAWVTSPYLVSKPTGLEPSLPVWNLQILRPDGINTIKSTLLRLDSTYGHH
jgi:hypothetical protein